MSHCAMRRRSQTTEKVKSRRLLVSQLSTLVLFGATLAQLREIGTDILISKLILDTISYLLVLEEECFLRESL